MTDLNIPEDFSTEAKFNMKARSQRRDRLAQLICKHGEEIEKDHLLGIFMLKNHVSLSTTYQYLQELIMARVVVENDGHILAMDHYIRANDEILEMNRNAIQRGADLIS